jgi:tripartite-type tricarboxylate transporter receptor subunit TctC
MKRLAALALATLCVVISLPAQARDETIHLVVGYAPGGGVDSIARAIGQELGQVLARTVVIDNRPGAGGSIAAQYVAAARPDGSTLLFGDTTLLTSPHVLRKVGYDPQRSFAPVARIAELPLVLVANPSVPANTPGELIALVKAAPDKYSFGTAGVATMHHFGGALINQAAGIDMTHVAYKGGAPAIQDLLGGQVPLAIASIPAVQQHIKAKRIKAIATLTPHRLASMPGLPALAEVLPGFDATPSVFILAPLGTSPAELNALAAALRTAVASKGVLGAFDAQGAIAAPLDAAALKAWMQSEEARWAALAEKTAISLD